ncbi:MAG TPA: hypothetical protein VGM39_08545 [Kofleriaceae bacterium]|jgi:hypothetical protein
MPSRPDLRDIASNVREAFADADKETLLDVLTFVLKEYVVEGPPPMLVHQAEQLSDLKGASFAQLIAAMQTRFDHAELAQFVVDGESVSVRINGVVQPLVGGRTPMQPIAPPAQFVDTRPPQPGVRVVEATLQQRPAAPAPATPPPAREGSAPPPSRGLSLRGRPSGEGDAPAAPSANQGAAPPAANQPAPAAPAAAPDKPESGGGGDDASTRFGLLELD